MRLPYEQRLILVMLCACFLLFSVRCGQSGGAEEEGLEGEVLSSSGGDDIGDDYLKYKSLMYATNVCAQARSIYTIDI